ncbi:hypothetical protein BDA99DRAFT_531817 [Phascolomyces articulosus]|uniref:Uncharacterized protein n=1 Tax=Phascolomyces articulosus TaxID=60185 RepID=A0AAD5PL11_9FUNG|nr:hypothetical protein BDA99DRAFT_531817 [Phascolomyces articulosus]
MPNIKKRGLAILFIFPVYFKQHDVLDRVNIITLGFMQHVHSTENYRNASCYPIVNGILILMLLLIVAPQKGSPFCIYNQAQSGIFSMLNNRFMERRIETGMNVCCHFDGQQNACSDVNDTNQPVKFRFDLGDAIANKPVISYNITGVPGGNVVFTGTVRQPNFKVTNAKEELIQFQLKSSLNNDYKNLGIPYKII